MATKYLEKRGERYFYRRVLKGRKIRVYVGTSEPEARRRAEILRRRHDQVGVPDLSDPVATLFEEWMTQDVSRKCKPKQVKLRRRQFEMHILPAMGPVRIADVRRSHLEELSSRLRSEGCAVNTQRNVLSALRRLFTWGVEREVITHSPFAGGAILPPKPKRAPRRLTDAEVVRIRAALGDHPRQLVAVDLGLHTGLRWGELRDLLWRHVGADYLWVDDGKTGARQIPLNAAALRVLRGLDKESLFVLPYRPQDPDYIARVSRRIVGFHWHFHQLRHTFACRFLEAGGSIEVLSKILGHSTVTTTEIYGAVSFRVVEQEFRRVFGTKEDQSGGPQEPTDVVNSLAAVS